MMIFGVCFVVYLLHYLGFILFRFAFAVLNVFPKVLVYIYVFVVLVDVVLSLLFFHC